jgi:hypothetical protein
MVVSKVLQAFIQHEFKDFPGFAMVDRGKYLILNLANSRVLDESNWSGYVAPGSTIAMSMIVHKLLELPFSQEDRCPESGCSDMWRKPETQSWVISYVLECRCMSSLLTKACSPICQKQILTFPATDLNNAKKIIVQRSFNHGFSRRLPQYEEQFKTSRPIHPIRPETEINDVETELEDDISFFKRIVQAITDLRLDPSQFAQTAMESITINLTSFRIFDKAFFLVNELVFRGVTVSDTRFVQSLRNLDEVKLAFKRTVKRLLGLAPKYSKTSVLGLSSVGPPEEIAWVMKSIFESLTPRLGLHLFKSILDIVKGTSRIMKVLTALTPDGAPIPDAVGGPHKFFPVSYYISAI